MMMINNNNNNNNDSIEIFPEWLDFANYYHSFVRQYPAKIRTEVLFNVAFLVGGWMLPTRMNN
jgi:hypothetical protein